MSLSARRVKTLDLCSHHMTCLKRATSLGCSFPYLIVCGIPKSPEIYYVHVVLIKHYVCHEQQNSVRSWAYQDFFFFFLTFYNALRLK